MQTSLTGSWIAVIGLIVAGASQLGFDVTSEQLQAIIGGAIALYGVVHQIVVHKQTTGKWL